LQVVRDLHAVASAGHRRPVQPKSGSKRRH
jgi:hypothetical protein